jgi:metallophosphoesterase (TIGR03767 family)
MSMDVSRRRFLEGVAAVAAATQLPFGFVEQALAGAGGAQGATGTTLDQTILPPSGTAYGALVVGAGEPWAPHPENPVARPAKAKRQTLLAFSQLSDIHITDAQSPLRVEWMDRFATEAGCTSPFPVGSAYRPQETMSTQTMAAMVSALNRVQALRIAAKQVPLAFALSTGDNTDNQHTNELRWFKRAIVGGTLDPNSGAAGRYEGVQAPDWGDLAYWLPDDAIRDDYKARYGYPGESRWGYGKGGLLGAAIRPFAAPKLNHPCKVAFGNHDGCVQGTVSNNALFRQIATGGQKAYAGLDAGSCPAAPGDDPSQWFSGPTRAVTADASRRLVTRREYIQELVGHGFTAANVASSNAYYVVDDHRPFRIIVLDTVNPGGKEDGSIGRAQLAWLQARIAEVPDRYVILTSHHGLHALTNPVVDLSQDPEMPLDGYVPDNPRALADEVEAALHAFPNVIAWVAGHTHQNRITKRQGANGHVFWDIETAAHVDWPCQSRTIEVVDDGPVLTIRCTMVDHAGPVRPDEIAATTDPVLKLAAVHRELAGNDPQVNRTEGSGAREDRNVELTLAKPALAGR